MGRIAPTVLLTLALASLLRGVSPATETRTSRPWGGVSPTIGVVLPLTGEYRAFGEACLRGIRLALGSGAAAVVRADVRDSAGTAAGATSAFRGLAEAPGTVAVLGPMLSWEVAAAAPLAEAAGLPALSFSKRHVPPGGPLFRFSMTLEAQAQALAGWAVRDQGLRRWAILYPEISAGTRAASEFRQSVFRHGGEIAAVVSYDPAKVDYQGDVRQLRLRLGMGELIEEKHDGTPRTPRPRPRPPIDGVFLPDSVDRVILIVPQLAFFDIRDVQLLGTSGWNRPDRLRLAMPHVDGAVFADGFFRYSSAPEVRHFVDAYRDVFQADPGVVEAYGYDAASLLRHWVRAGAHTREAVLERLREPATLEGATGTTRTGKGGEIRKGISLLELEDGSVREIRRLDPTAGSSPRRRTTAPWP